MIGEKKEIFRNFVVDVDTKRAQIYFASIPLWNHVTSTNLTLSRRDSNVYDSVLFLYRAFHTAQVLETDFEFFTFLSLFWGLRVLRFFPLYWTL